MGMLAPNGLMFTSSAGELFWLFFMKIVEHIVEDQIIAVLVLSLKGEKPIVVALLRLS